jgi:hypothetical protein
MRTIEIHRGNCIMGCERNNVLALTRTYLKIAEQS